MTGVEAVLWPAGPRPGICQGRREHREPSGEQRSRAEFSSTQVHRTRVRQRGSSVNWRKTDSGGQFGKAHWTHPLRKELKLTINFVFRRSQSFAMSRCCHASFFHGFAGMALICGCHMEKVSDEQHQRCFQRRDYRGRRGKPK